MKILMPSNNTLTVQREKGDKPYRPGSARSFSPGWYGAESNLLYTMQKYLKSKGIPCIKKRVWKDGHMFGEEQTQYIRSPGKSGPGFYLYYGNHALRCHAQEYNKYEVVRFDLWFDVFAPEGADRPEEATKQAAAFRALLEAP